MCGANVVLEVGFGHKILSTGGVPVERPEVGGTADVKGTADVALAIVCSANMHCEVGLLGEGLGAAEIGAWDIFALRKGRARVLAFDVFLEGWLADASSVTERAVCVFLLDMGL